MKISNATRSILLLTLFCGLLLSIRIIKTQSSTGFFLAWNLFLAWMPLFIILITRRLFIKTKNTFVAFFGIILWLLFFPNSPYIITDLKHIGHLQNSLVWFDSLGIFSCAITGFLVGLYSLRIAHQLVNQYFNVFFSWLIIGFFSLISGFGVYLGRYLRFNSWDLFTHPFRLFKVSLLELKKPLCLQSTLLFGLTILFFYIALEFKNQQRNELSESSEEF